MELKKLWQESRPSTKSIEWPRSKGNPASRLAPHHFLFLFSLFLLAAWGAVTTELWLREQAAHRGTVAALLTLQNRWQTTQNALTELKQENHVLETLLAGRTQTLEHLREEKRAADQNLESFQLRNAELRQRLFKLLIRYREIRNSTPPVQKKSEADEFSVPLDDSQTKGTVIRVNPVYQFAIVDLGKKQGVKEGEDLFVVRDGTPLNARLRIERPYDNFSACSIIFDDPSESLQLGDTVVRRS